MPSVVACWIQKQFLEIMEELNLVTRTVMISSYGVHSKGEKSLALFRKIIDQAWLIFNSISLEYGFEPTVEFYACMVDLLGRFGNLKESNNSLSRISNSQARIETSTVPC